MPMMPIMVAGTRNDMSPRIMPRMRRMEPPTKRPDPQSPPFLMSRITSANTAPYTTILVVVSM